MDNFVKHYLKRKIRRVCWWDGSAGKGRGVGEMAQQVKGLTTKIDDLFDSRDSHSGRGTLLEVVL